MSTLSYEPNWGGIDGVFQQVALIYHEEVYGTSRNFWKFQNWEYMYQLRITTASKFVG